MNLFRKHIIRHLAGLALLLAISMQITSPYSSKAQKTAFVQWLDENVISSGSDSESLVRSHIRRLPVETDSFDLFLIKVSKLVASNQQDFKIPEKPADEEPGHLGRWLILQWSFHQQSTSGQDAILPQALPLTQKWAAGTNNFQSTALKTTFSSLMNRLPEISPMNVLYIPARQLSTWFTGSVSINAP